MASIYGRGMRIEITEAILNGELQEPVTTNDIKNYMNSKGWYPKKGYINVFLGNSSSEEHSLSYPKIFTRVGEGEYMLKRQKKL